MKKRILSLLLVVVMVLSMFPTAFAEEATEPVYEAVGENLFLNGGFELLGEDGKPLNTATGGMGDQQVWGTNWAIETNPENVYEGNNSLLASTASWTMIYPKHADMIPGETYQISYKIKGTFLAGGADKEFGLNFLYNGGNTDISCGGDVVYAKADEWTTYTAVFTVPEDADASRCIGLHLAWGEGTVYLDDFQCYKLEEVVPEEPEGPILDTTNLFLNGGFELLAEDGKPLNTATGGMGDQQVWGTNWAIETNPENVYEGNNSLLASTASWTMIYPKHAEMIPGETYQISYKIKGTFLAGGVDKEFGLNFLYHNGNTDVSCGGDVVYAKADEWTTYTALFTVPEDAADGPCIGLHLAWGEGTVYLDDFQMYKVLDEEPAPEDPVVPDDGNLIVNGNIETLGDDGNPANIEVGTNAGASGWGASAYLETEKVYEGSHSIKLVNQVNNSYAKFTATVEPYTNYIFSFKALGKVDADAKVGALIYAHGETTNYEKTYEGENIVVNENDWTTLTYKVNSESYTTLQFLVGSFWAASTLYIDDVRLEVDTTPVDPDAPVENVDMGDVFNNKVFYYPGATDGGAEVKFIAKYDVGANYTVDAALKDGDTVLWSQEDLEVVNHVAEFTYDTALMTEKEHAYTTEVTVRDINGNAVSVITEDCYIYDPPTVFNENGEYVEEDGTIFNPVFAFWGPDQWEELEDLAAAGVNCVLWTIPNEEEEALRQLDDLHAMGMKANVVMFWGMQPTGHPSNKDRVQTQMNWIKDHPAIYCWNVADEPYATADPPAGSTVRDLMIESFKVIRAVDDKYPVTYVDADYNQYKHADDYVDYVMIDPYPGAQSFASWIGDKATIMADFTDRPFAVIQQSFGFAGYEPYAHELHSMMYQAYLAGANAQGYYGIGHGTPHLEAHPTLWPVIKGFYESGEWEVLFKQYSSGKNPTIASNRSGDVWYDVFELDGDYFAILQNRTFVDQTVNIDLDFAVDALHVMTWSDDVSVTASATETGITATLTSAQAFMLKLNGEPYEFTPANPELPPQPEKPEIDSEGNLIVNGSFETLGESSGNPTGVVPCQSGGNPQWGSTHFLTTDPEFVYEGTNSVKIVNVDASTWSYLEMQAPQIEPGYNYTFSFKVKGTSGGNKIGSLIYAHGPSGSHWSFENAVTGEAVVPNMDEWTTLTYKFNSGSYTSMQFLVGGFWFANELYIDDVQLIKDPGQEAPDTPDPEDPTAGLVAIGDNKVSNGDVEYVTDGQANDIRPTDADWTNGIVEVSTDAYEGSYAIKLNSDGNGQDYVQFKGRNMEGGKWYEVRFMMKGDIKTENGRDATFFIDTECYKDNEGHAQSQYWGGLATVAVDGSNVFTPTSDWTEGVYRFQLKDGSCAVALSFSIMGPSGYILVDNVSIHELGEKEPTFVYGENKASNGEIEYVTDGAANDINGDPSYVEVITGEDAYEGNYSLRLNSDGVGQDFFQIKGRNMEAGKTYQVDFMMRGDIKTNNGRAGTFFVDTECYTDNEGHAKPEYWGKLASPVVPDSNVFTPTTEWTPCSYQFVLNEGCCAVALSFSIMGPSGYIDVDNVTIREVTEGEPEPEEPTITYGENKASNGEIEYVTNGAANDINGDPSYVEVITGEDAYEGNYSLRLNSDGVGQDFFQIKGRNMEAGKTYQVDFMMRGDIKTNNGRAGTFFVDTECYTDNEGHAKPEYWGKLASPVVPDSNVFTPTSEWTPCSYQFVLNDGCCAVALSFSIMGPSGYIDVDNVTIREVIEGGANEPEEPEVPEEPVGNLLANGGFETLGDDGNPVGVAAGASGNPAGWGENIWLETEHVYEGSNAIKLLNRGDLGFAEIKVAGLEPATDYVFSFKAKGEVDGNGNVAALIYAHGDGVKSDWAFEAKAEATPSPVNMDKWTTVTYKFNSDVYNAMDFLICSLWSASTLYIDDVQLVKASEYVPEEPTPDEPEVPEEPEATGNLFLNGGFELVDENGKPLDTSTGGMGDQQVWGTNWAIETNPDNVYEGSNSLMASTQSWTMIYPKHEELRPGATYYVSYKIKGSFVADGADKAFGLNFLYNGGMVDVDCGGEVVYAKADEWTTYTAVFTVPEEAGNTGSIGLHLAWGQGSVYLDDFQLYKVGTENLFLNGGFENLAEDGKPLDTSTGGMGDQQVWGTNWAIETNADNVYEGNNSLLASTQSWTMIYPKHTDVEPGATYLISYKLKGTFIANGADKEFGLNFLYNGGNTDVSCGGEVIYAKADEWTTYTALFTVPEDAISGVYGIGLHLAWGEGTVYLDDFQMYKVGVANTEEPETPEEPGDSDYLSYVTDSVDGINWIRNNAGTFEGGWDFGSWQDSEIVTDEAGAFEGSAYAKLNAAVDGASQIGVVAVTLPTPGVEVKVVAMVKGDAGNLTLHLQHYRNDNSFIGIDNSNVIALEASDDWHQVVFTATLPADVGGTTGGGTETYLIYSGEGTICIDDVQFFYPKEEEPEVTYGNNVMKNGSFEELDGNGKPVNVSTDYGVSPTQAGWEVTHSLVTGEGYTTDGNYALKITDNEARWARAVMKADIEPNRSYLLTLDVKGTSSAPIGALIYAYGSANGTNWDLGIPAENQVMPNPDEWTTLEYVFENTDYTSLEFLFGCVWNNLDVIIDNVQLREIGGTATEPEPEEPSEPDVLPEIPHESTNYVVNGSFEDLDDAGKPIGMGFGGAPSQGSTIVPDWGVTTFVTTEPEYVTDGNNALKIDLTESGWGFANLHAYVEPNTQYVLYIDGRGSSNLSIGADIEYWKNDSGDVKNAHIQHTSTKEYGKKVNSDSWTTMYWVFTTPAECHYMEIAVSVPWTTGTLYVDNIRVYRLANNFAENGNFESVEDGKAVGINTSTGWANDNIAIETAEENVYEGSNSLKLTSTDGAHTWAQVPARNLTPGATYQVSFWMKGDLSRTDGKIPTFGYDLEQYTDNNGHNKGEFWGGLGKGASFPTTDEWQYCVEYFTLPDDIVAVNLTMGMIGATGTVYLDDVRIQKYEDAAMGELLNERVFYYPEDETGFAELTFPEAYAVAENYVLDIALTDGSLVLAEEKNVAVVGNYAIFNYDLSLLTKKEHAYTVIATLTDADGDVVSTMQEDIYIYDRPTVLNENNEYVEEDGSIFNPVYAFWGPDQWDELDDLAAAGVNTILWTIPSTDEAALQQLDELHALGMKANVVMFWDMEPTGHPVNAERVIARMEAIKDHPAIYAWNVADEPYATANPPRGHHCP